MTPARVHVVVQGEVQGVFFREFTRRRAESLGVNGWVRNRSDGRVEGVFEGDRSSVDLLVSHMREGPPHSRVEGVEVISELYRGEFVDFRVTR